MTAVDFIKKELDRLGLLDKGEVMTNIFEQAKEMEKQEHDKIYEHAFNYGVASSQTEISDEEIEKTALEFFADYKKAGASQWELSAFIMGMKKYREQLKKK